MLKRLILGLYGLFALVNGALMMLAGEAWFAAVAADTGSYNSHLVLDVGAAVTASGLALMATAWRPALWPAAMTGAGFLGAHGLIHLAGIVEGHLHHPVRDILTLTLPSLLSLWAAWPAKRRAQGEEKAEAHA